VSQHSLYHNLDQHLIDPFPYLLKAKINRIINICIHVVNFSCFY
jgi:hypothetical protein